MKRLIVFACLSFVVSCQGSDLGQNGTKPPSHEIWDGLLRKHVDGEGIVDYKGFIADMDQLDNYLSLISKNAPDRQTWSEQEQLAYWINAYNAFTVKLIADNYPVESIQDLHPKIKIPLVNTVWHIKFFQIGGEDANLDEIEHKILRKEFDEPRIHFAINCASFSCPPLRNEAFVVSKLDQQLDDMAKRFINDPKRNRIQKNQAEISKIFSWFKGDFTKNGSLIDYLNQYSTIRLDPKAKISYMEYDWSLNE
ncbi:DUF547 domain-containing protein [Pararhodonellum marinum]|uniref:DUF547 domain-containing protein n=1 Tax=Pararhodonellum marinum TaxID=2755358 RepID=UPI0018904853|nr:DUF547 domain-containing protein [Pararhodonellum marinum]